MTQSIRTINERAVLGRWISLLAWLTVFSVIGGGCKGSGDGSSFGEKQYSTDFSSADELKNWNCYDGGKWEIRDGWLVADARPTKYGRSILWLNIPFVEDVQIEFEAECLDAPNDLNCFIGGNGKEYSGYEIILGGFGNEKIAVYKCNADGDDLSRNRLTREDFSVKKDHVYGIKIKKYRGEFRVYVDDELLIRKQDSNPISDKQHRYFGFSTYKTVVRFDNLKIKMED